MAPEPEVHVNGAVEQIYDASESAARKQQQEMLVGGIPLNKIKELVSEAMSAADLHKHTLRSAPAGPQLPPHLVEQMKANQKSYGSANSVVWDDEHKAANNLVEPPPIVKEVVSEIASNPQGFFGKAQQQIGPVMGPSYAEVAASSAVQTTIHPTSPIPPSPVAKLGKTKRNKNKQLSSLLKKGFFGEMTAQAGTKS